MLNYRHRGTRDSLPMPALGDARYIHVDIITRRLAIMLLLLLLIDTAAGMVIRGAFYGWSKLRESYSE